MKKIVLLLLCAGITWAQSLQGVIDVHAHVDPETIPRSIDAITLARMAQEEGMRAVVFKNHFFPTTGIAFLVHRVVPGIEVFGGIALNRQVGGINPAAVEQMVQLPGRFGRIVWMPTMDSEAGARQSSTPRPFVPIAKNGELLPETKQVLAIIAREDIALATGHIAPEESLMLIREARNMGVNRIIVTHPTQGVNMSVDQQKQAAAMGAFVEYCYVGTLPFSGANQKTMAYYAQNMRAVGPAHVIMSSDLGNAVNPVHPAGMRSYIQALLKEGMGQDDIDQMVRKNPAYLLGLK